jgi:hypothetical protein
MATCEEYTETAKRTIQKAGRGLEKFNSPAPDILTQSQTLLLMNHSKGTPTPSSSYHVKLPPSN